ncbi:MAG: DUF1841 family protein [bacterium]|nr:DUF1841 family protein [bacterium]
MEDYHSRAGVEMPSPRSHAAFHTMVENQLAMELPAEAPLVLERLMGEGLDRHDAVHAIASVLAKYMHRAVRRTTRGDPNSVYRRELRRLTAKKWLAS